MDSADQITVARKIDAPVERVFAMLADPDRHPDFDGSENLRGSQTHSVLTEVGEVFRMDMRREEFGDYQTDNVVTTYQRDVEIGWSPAPAGRPPLGHSYTYRLEPDGDDRTVVTLTYDWSAVSEPRIRTRLPLVSREELDRSLDLLARAL
jgi:uncharacterized protein YndB with AHSA1/START domain